MATAPVRATVDMASLLKEEVESVYERDPASGGYQPIGAVLAVAPLARKAVARIVA